MNPQIILLVEDNPSIREGVRILLGGEGYMIGEAASGEEALAMMNDTVDLVILDVMLPGMSGIQVCEKIREMTNVPILFLTAKSQETDKALGLLAGGDDYLTKPFSFVELVARVKALLRRYQIYHGKGSQSRQSNSNSLTSGRLQLQTDRNAVKKDGLSLDLTDLEYGILALLMKHPLQIFSTQEIYEQVWKEVYTFSANSTVMVHIRKLRTKIEDDPQNPVFIKNVWGKGYRYEA